MARERLRERYDLPTGGVNVQRGREETTASISDSGWAVRRGRLREDAAEKAPGASPDQVVTRETDSGYEAAAIRTEDAGEVPFGEYIGRKKAASRFESDTPFDDVDPFSDVRSDGDGYSLTEDRQREAAAASIDEQLPGVAIDTGDVRETDDGFAPTEGARRRAAAGRIEEETALEDVDPRDDLAVSGPGFGLTEPRQRDLAAEQLDPQFPGQDLGRGDVRETDDGFGVTDDVLLFSAAQDLDEQYPGVGIGTGDVEETGDGFGLDREAQKEVGAARLDERLPEYDVGADDVEFEDDSLVFEGVR